MRSDIGDLAIQNGIRTMYCEEKFSLFLEKNIQNYDCAIVCGPDYYLLEDINLDHIENSINNNTNIYTSVVNDANGYTDGFYIGSLIPMIKNFKKIFYFR